MSSSKQRRRKLKKIRRMSSKPCSKDQDNFSNKDKKKENFSKKLKPSIPKLSMEESIPCRKHLQNRRRLLRNMKRESKILNQKKEDPIVYSYSKSKTLF